MDVIQEVGSYAGFAAVIGLAVLSALYFSQGRDVRRLREWAGRAPERAAEQAVQQPAAPEQAAQEAARPAAGAVKPIPAVKPAAAKPSDTAPAEAGKPAAPKPGEPAKPPAGVPATAAATAAAPATTAATAAGDKKATPGAPPVPATAAAAASQPTAGPAPATPAGAPAKGKPDGGKPDAPAKPPAAPAPAASSPRTTPPPARPPAVPARPGPVARSPAAAAASQSTAVLPASSARLRDRTRRGGSEREGLSPRYIALIVAGVIVIGGGVVFGISQLGGDDEGATPSESSSDGPLEPVNPSTVTVSVLNGTTVPGLAAQIGDEVESAGFQRGNVANALDQQRTTSVVLYAEGADREAKLVARKLGINTVEPIDPDSQALGGNASVVVIVGADQTQ